MVEEQTITKLVPETDPILKQRLELFDFENPPIDPIELAHILAEAMIVDNGMGLSSNQIGLPHRAFVITGSPILCCFNPKIVDASEEQIYLEEGCLSFPNLYIKIKRPIHIKVRYTQANGETVTKKLTGMTARIFQHELDHLDGITMLVRASRLERERAFKRRKLIKRRKNG